MIQRQRTGKRLFVESHVGCAATPQTGVGRNAERKCSKNRLSHIDRACFYIFFEGEKMDKLQQIASSYNDMVNKQYYFEIARKQKMLCFILSFEKSDFYHLAGLHKLTDIAALQGEPNKRKVFDNILNGKVSYDLLKRSRFHSKMNTKLELLTNLEDILDSNQIVFKYIGAKNQVSRIEADCLLESVYNMNIVFIFLADRYKSQSSNVPIMCSRFFPRWRNMIIREINQYIHY